MRIEIREDGEGGYIAEIVGTNFVAFGKTKMEALSSLCKNLRIIYEGYEGEDDDNLTEGARRLKRLVLDIYGEVRGDE